MKVENQVCTLEQANKLKGLGVKQESLFRYVETGEIRFKFSIDGLTKGVQDRMQSAFTVAELGVMLPAGFDSMKYTVTPKTFKWHGYDNFDDACPMPYNEDGYKTEAEVRAEMLIYLLEKNLILVEKVNQRLIN